MTRAPLAFLAAAWLVGLLSANSVPASGWPAACALLALVGGLACCVWSALPSALPWASHWVLGALVGAAFVCGLSAGPRDTAFPPTPPAGLARIEGIVEESSLGIDRRGRAVLRVLRGARVEDNAALIPGSHLYAGPLPLMRGARVQLLAKVSPRLPFRNPSPHPRSPPRFAVTGRAFIGSAQAVRVLDVSLSARLLDAARAHVRDALIRTLPPSAAGVARALVLGEGQAVAEDEQADVRGAGLLHVFAVSGLHVAILAGLFVAILHRVLLRVHLLAAGYEARRFACALGVPAALLYAEFAGGAPSAWRAAVTAAFGWTLVACGRRPQPSALCAMTALAIGVFDPSEVTRPAFLLSIVATAAILMEPSEQAQDLRGWLRAAFALSARTTLATAPIVLWCFGNVPIAGVLANVVLLPFGSLLLVQGSALHALLAVFTPFGAWSGRAFALLSDAFLAACRVFADVAPSGTWPPPDLWQGITLAVAAAWLLLANGWRARVSVVAITVCCIGLLEWRLRYIEQPVGRLRVTFLDVGQGDAALVDLPDGRLMLIDAGGNPGGGPDPGSAVLLPLLQARRRARIDLAVLTHPHPDHYGGFNAILQQFPILELWDSGQATAEADLSPTSAEAAELLRLARERGTRVRDPRTLCGKAIAAGRARIRVLAPCPGYDSGLEPNDNSLVVRIDFGKRSLLFAGDAEAHEEASLVAQWALLRADVLKVAHHGSRTSTTAAFLHAVSPQLAVISAGAGNRFGHPHPDVLGRLQAKAPHVISLAETGGALLSTDGHVIDISTWSGARTRLPPSTTSVALGTLRAHDPTSATAIRGGGCRWLLRPGDR